MKEHIDPITLQKLDEFNLRRKQLLGLRGICTFLITAIVLFSTLATVDLYVLLPDATRAFLTYAAWIIVATLVWVTSIGKLVRKPTRRELAKYIEDQEPNLREDLLSAIELGVERTDPKHDSPVFRALLQNDVADRVRKLDINNTLPLSLLGKWIKTSAALLIFLFALLLIPDFGKDFSTALGRTMLGANLARVSDIHIELLSPKPDQTYPEGETIRIKAALKGPKDELRSVKKVILETTGKDNEYHRTTMDPDNEKNFIARLNILSKDTRFRIQAGLAQSQWFSLDTAARPKVEHFDITYTPPAYTQLSPSTIRETTKGDIEGIENTRVQLNLKTNQPIQAAELRLDLATTPANRVIPLQISDKDPTLLQTPTDALRLFAQGTYRVHLVSKSTEFENKYSPKYEIAVQSDQAPSLELIEPTRNLLVQADEILAIRARADDDLPIQRLDLQLRTNNGRWVSNILAETKEDSSALQAIDGKLTTLQSHPDTARKNSINAISLYHTLDLLNHTLTPGDRVKLKLVAYDLKKQRTETQPIELTILSRNFETSRIETVAAQARIQKQLKTLLNSLNKVGEDASKHSQLLKTLNPQDPQSSIQWATFADLSKQVHEDTLHAFEEISAIARTLPKGAPAREAAYALRTLGRILHEVNAQPPAYIESARESIDQNKTRQYLDDARNRYHEARGRTGSLNAQFTAISAGTLRAILAEDLHNLVKQQHEILPSNVPNQDDPLFWKRLARREKAAVNQALTIERNLERLGHVVVGHLGTTYQKASHELSQARDDLQQALEAAEATQPGPELLAPAKVFKQKLIDFLKKAGSHHNSLYSKALKEHRNLTTQTEDDLHSIYRALFVGRDLLNNHKAEKDNQANGNTRQANIHAANVRHFQRLLSQATWPGAIGRIKSSAVATETRRDADNQFAKDAGMTALALDNLAQKFSREYSTRDGDPANVLKELEKIALAYRKLEHVHLLIDIQQQIKNIAHTEKWQLRHPSALMHTPYEWQSAHKFMPEVAKKMKASLLNPQAVRILAQLPHRDFTKAFSDQMTQRLQSIQNPKYKPTRKTRELQLILAEIAEVLRLLQPEIREAREFIQDYTPTIADLARDLAEKTEQLNQETKEQAKDAEQTQDPETKRAELQELQDKQEALMADLKDLTDALRQDANTQDILTEEGRERARDADDSIAMLQEPATEAQQNLQQANLSQRTEDQVRELNETTQSQQELQQALEQVAEHYDNLDNPEALAESRQELRAAEEELGIARELEEQYSQIERLAELSQLDPDQLLTALENELEENRLMQTQLSNITQDTLEETQENLEDASRKEDQIPDQLARSDKEAIHEAKNLAKELNKIGQEARKIAKEEVHQANQSARKAQDATASDQLEQTRRELDQLGRLAENASRSNNPRDIAETAQDLIDPLQEVSKDLSEAAKEVADLQKTNAQNAQPKADQLQKQADELTQQAKDAAKKANELIAEANAAKEDALQAQQDFLAANDQPSPSNESTQPSPEQAEQNFEQAVAKAQQAQQTAREAQQQANELRNEANQANREAKAAQNLANQFEKNQNQANQTLQQAKQAQQKADAASNKTKDLAKRAQDIAEKLAEAIAQISPSEQALDQANQNQENINRTAEQAAQDLARAARHEERLGNEDVAQELANLAQDAAASLEQPTENASQQLQSLDGDNQLSDLAEAAQDIANNEATQARNSAQKADQDQLSQEIGQTAQELSKAAEQAQIASEQQDPAPSNISEAAKALSEELQQAAQEFAQQAQEAQQAAQQIQEPAQQAQQNAEQAQQAAQQAQQQAQQAQEAFQQAQQAQQTAQQAQQAAQQAQQQAQQAQQQAQQAAENAAQDPAAAETAQEAATQAQQAAAQAQQTARQTQQTAQEAAQQANQQAQEAAQAAQQAAQQAQQAEQETPQTAQNASKSAKEAQQAAQTAQQAAQQAQQSAQQAAQYAAENQGSELAQQAAQTAQNAAQQAEQAAQQASEAAQQASEAAQQAAQQAQQQTPENQKESNQAAQSASENAQFSAQTAQQAAQLAQQAAQMAENPEAQPLQTARKATQTAQQAAQAAQQAAQQAQQQAQTQTAKSAPEAAAAQNAANQAQQAAQEAAQLAQAAGELADGLGNAPPSDAAPFDQPFAEASEALAQQAQNLDDFFNEGLAQAQTPASAATPASPASPSPASPSPASASPATPATPSQASPASPAQASSPGTPSSPSTAPPSSPALPQSAPFTNPETAQALAQTLDAVDQALTEAQAEAASGEAAAGTPAEPGSALSQSAESQAAGTPTPGTPAQGSPAAPSQGAPSPSTPGAPTPGAPSQGQPTPGAPGSPSQSMAEAAQALAQAAAAQSAAMSQARNASQMPGQNPVGQGLQLNSGAGAASIAGDIPYQQLEEINRKADLDWGKLPKQMAKDLMEGSQEDISGEYRQQVQTYFRAIAELARQNKE